MAFVILSAGALARSKMHTVSSRTLGVSVAAAMLLTLAGGFALGYGYSRHSADVPPVTEISAAEPPVEPAPQAEAPPAESAASPEGRLLIDRFGELAGRMVQLEAEAAGLAARLETIGEFEGGAKPDAEPAVKTKAKATTARASSGGPAGGPLLNPGPAAEAPQISSLGILATDRVPGDPERLPEELERMERDIERLAKALAAIDEAAVSYNLAHLTFPGRPPVAEGRMTSGFGNRLDPFRGRLAFHSGIDFPAPKGTPILASAGGQVIFAGYKREYGNTVEIEHGAGLVTRYAHASKLHVKAGQVVMPGHKIAEVGSTGRSTGPHLHFEILKDGRFADPARYLARF